MTSPAFSQGGAVDDTDGTPDDSPTLLDLTAGPARITPVWTPEDGVQYNIELPEGPLTPDDAEYLALGLQTTHAGGAVLIDIDEYTEPQ